MTTAIGDLSRPALPGSTQRYDPLAQFTPPPPRPPVDVRGGGRLFWAFCLLAAGLGVTGWLVVLMHSAVFAPETVGLLDHLAPDPDEAFGMTLPAGKVVLPPEWMTIVGYVFLVLLVSIAARIAAMMIRHGVSLLRPQLAADKTEPDLHLPRLASGV